MNLQELIAVMRRFLIRLLVLGVGLADAPARAGECQPERIGAIGGTVQDVAIVDSKAFVASGSGLLVLDVTDPAKPTILGSVATPDLALDVAVSGDLAYVAYGSVDPPGGEAEPGRTGHEVQS